MLWLQHEPSYTPQVEAISPTLPPDERADEPAQVKQCKDELVLSINRMDKEISQLDAQIVALKKKRVSYALSPSLVHACPRSPSHALVRPRSFSLVHVCPRFPHSPSLALVRPR